MQKNMHITYLLYKIILYIIFRTANETHKEASRPLRRLPGPAGRKQRCALQDIYPCIASFSGRILSNLLQVENIVNMYKRWRNRR